MGWVKSVELWGRKVLVSTLSVLFRTRPVNHLTPEGLRKVLVLRQDKLGDFIITTPLLRAIKTALPHAQLDLLCSRTNLELALADPSLDHVLLYDKKRPWRVVSLLWRIRRERYDVIADPWDNISTTAVCVLLIGNPRYTIGFGKGVKVLDVAVPPLKEQEVHIIERTLELIRAFGTDPKTFDPRPGLRLTPEAIVFRDAFLRSESTTGAEHQRIGLNVSAGVRTRQWPAERYGRICRLALEKIPSARFLLLSTPEDRPKLEAIRAELPENCILAPLTPNFMAFAALISTCDLLLTPDTSAIHVASAFGVPTVALYPKKHEYHAAWFPFHVPMRVVQSDSLLNMDSITPEQVADALGDLWNELHPLSSSSVAGEALHV